MVTSLYTLVVCLPMYTLVYTPLYTPGYTCHTTAHCSAVVQDCWLRVEEALGSNLGYTLGGRPL